MAIERGNDIAAHQACLIRRRTRGFDISESDPGAGLGSLKSVYAKIRAVRKADRNSRSSSHRLLNQAHNAAKDEKEGDGDQDPGHAANPAFSFAGKAADRLFGNRRGVVRIEI